jgi:phosphatidylserine/phosphatidylglycerophosphate/cardiolipin synthase-like enzyme
MADESITIGDSTEMSMTFALRHLERVMRAVPELSYDQVDWLTGQAEAMRARLRSIEDAAGWHRWRLDTADLRRNGGSF